MQAFLSKYKNFITFFILLLLLISIKIANPSFAGPGKYFSSPVQIGSETDWSDIFGHYEHTSLIKES